MKNNKLPKHFFEDNPINEFSTSMLTHFRMITLKITELNNKVDEIVVPCMKELRLEEFQIEKENIMNLSNA